MLVNVGDSIGNRSYFLAREARVECKDRAYHGTFKVHGNLVLQIREVLHCPVFGNTPVTSVPSTLVPEFRVIFLEGMHSLIFVDVSPVSSTRCGMKVMLKNSSGTSTVLMSATLS
jgi:hypothetical protein